MMADGCSKCAQHRFGRILLLISFAWTATTWSRLADRASHDDPGLEGSALPFGSEAFQSSQWSAVACLVGEQTVAWGVLMLASIGSPQWIMLGEEWTRLWWTGGVAACHCSFPPG